MSILRKRFNIAVVGGCNIDISATSSSALSYGDSNPGVVRSGLGGVGRNIAENLARLKQHTSLITALGGDSFAALAVSQAEAIGLDLSKSLRVPGASSSVYICVNDANGEMSVAVNDMALIARITPEYIQTKIDFLNTADAVIVDANLDESVIATISQECSSLLFAEAVSAKKAARLLPSLSRFYAIKANLMEAELLTGVCIQDERDLEDAANALHHHGVRYVLITLGARGAFISDGVTQASLAPFALPVMNTTGCGDALMAASTSAILEQMDIQNILQTGLAAAALCAQSERAVSESITREALADMIQSACRKEGKTI